MRYTAPRAPVKYQDAVELWARQWGRHGRIEWNEMMKCFCIHLTRRPDDPVMKEYQEGRLNQASPPTESFPLHRWSPEKGRYVAIPLDDLGVSGIENMLDEANSWSGRTKSHDEFIEETLSRNDELRREMKKAAREAGEEVGWLARRTALGLPQERVVADLSEESLNTPTKENNNVSG